jgi:hypothetical protein
MSRRKATRAIKKDQTMLSMDIDEGLSPKRLISLKNNHINAKKFTDLELTTAHTTSKHSQINN